MVKTLVKHGNSYALIIDKPIMDLLQIKEDSQLELTTDGSALIVAPADPKRRKKIQSALNDTMDKYSNMLKRLSE